MKSKYLAFKRLLLKCLVFIIISRFVSHDSDCGRNELDYFMDQLRRQCLIVDGENVNGNESENLTCSYNLSSVIVLATNVLLASINVDEFNRL